MTNKDNAVLVAHGIITMPIGMDIRDLSAAEEAYRRQLWPRPRQGMVRWSRELQWNGDRTQLYYRIFDVPQRGQE